MNNTQRLVDNLSIGIEQEVKHIIEKIWVSQLVEEFVKEIQPKIQKELELLVLDTIKRYYTSSNMKDNLNINFNLKVNKC